MPVQRHARLEAQGVARSEAARDEAVGLTDLQGLRPERGGLVGGEDDLEAVLAGVAGAGKRELAERAVGHAVLVVLELGRLREVECQHDGLGIRPLNREHGELVRLVVDGGIQPLRAGLEEGDVLVPVAGVHHEQERVLLAADQDVVLDAPGVIADQGVAGAAHRELGAVEGEGPVGHLIAVGAAESHAPHVGQVEEAGSLANGMVFGRDVRVADRHVVAREGHHSRTGVAMDRMKGGLAHGIGVTGKGAASGGNRRAVRRRTGMQTVCKPATIFTFRNSAHGPRSGLPVADRDEDGIPPTMTIRGEVETSELGNIFQMVSGLHHRSLLVLRPAEDYEVEHRLLIEQDRLRLDSEPSVEVSPALLLARGIIDEKRCLDLTRQSERSGLALEEWLLRARGADRELSERVLRLRHEESILEAITWGSLVFRVIDASERTPVDGPEFRLDPVLLESARRADEFETVAPALKDGILASCVRARDLPGDRWSPVDRLVFDAIDGTRDASELRRITGLPVLDVAAALQRLVDGGVVNSLALEDLRQEVPQRLRSGDLEVARRLASAAIHLSPEDPDLRGELAIIHERLGALGAASEQDLTRADLLEARGAREDLQRTLIRCRDRLPTDLLALRRLAEVMAEDGAVDPGRVESTLSATRELASWYEEEGDLVAAVAMTRCAFRIAPDQLTYGLELARREEALGHLAEAIELLGAITAAQLEAGRMGAARATLQDLSRLDAGAATRFERKLRKHDAAQERARGPQRATSRGRSPAAAVVAMAALLGLITIVVLAGGGSGETVGAPDPARAGVALGVESSASPQASEGNPVAEAPTPEVSPSPTWPATAESVSTPEKTLPTRQLLAGRRLELATITDPAARAVGERILGARLEAEQAVRDGGIDGARGILASALDQTPEGHPWRGDLAELLRDVEVYLVESNELRERADAERMAGRPDEAWRLARRLLDLYPAAPAASGLLLPVRLEVTPSNARIRLPDGREDHGSIELEVQVGEQVPVSVSRPGWGSEQLSLAPPERTRVVRHVLRRSTQRSIVLPADALALASGTSPGEWIVASADGRRFRVARGSDRGVELEARPEVGQDHLVARDGVRPRFLVAIESGIVREVVGERGGRLPLVPGERVAEVLARGDDVVARTSNGRVLGMTLGSGWAIGVPFGVAAPAQELVRGGRHVLVVMEGNRSCWLHPDGTAGEPFIHAGARFFGVQDRERVLVAIGGRHGHLDAGARTPRMEPEEGDAILSMAERNGRRLVLRSGGILTSNDPGRPRESHLSSNACSVQFHGADTVEVRLRDGAAILLSAERLEPFGRFESTDGDVAPIGIVDREILFAAGPRLLGGMLRP